MKYLTLLVLLGLALVGLAVAAGLNELGENRVQEVTAKYHAMQDLNIRWSIIGNLQTNKARDVAAYAAEFQALDRLRVAEVLDRRLEDAGRTLPDQAAGRALPSARRGGAAEIRHPPR